MSDATSSNTPPSPDQLSGVFDVYDVDKTEDAILYYGIPQVPPNHIVENLWPVFEQSGYEVQYTRRTGEDVLVVTPKQPTSSNSIPWTHIILFSLTVLSTLFAGAMWFHVDVTSEPLQIWRGWPFAAAILTVLGIHELGHYVLGRYHGVNVTLPYFIPIPTLIGTMGAVIRLRGRIPDRRALFDIGVAGPIAGIIATIIVTTIGLFLGPVTVPETVVEAENAVEIELGYPPLMEILAWITGQQLYYEDPTKMVHPVVIGGWVGMFVTFLNMIPVGQLDGGHIVRALAAEYQETIASLVPGALFGLAGVLYFFYDVAFQSIFVWIVWGGLALLVAFAGPANPVRDSDTLGPKRKIIGIVAFALAALCFAPIPIQVQ